MDDEHLIKWFPFTTGELKRVQEALICMPSGGQRRSELIEEIRAVLAMRKKTPHG